MMRRAGVVILFVVAVSVVPMTSSAQALQLGEREKISLNIPRLAYSIDEVTREFTGVKITFPGDEDRPIFIGTYNDIAIKNTSRGSEKTVHRESPEKSGFITSFEARAIAKVNDRFIDLLETFEKLLKKRQWSRCRYFDSFFPNFLKGYYYLLSAAKNSENALSSHARVPEEVYDVSMSSPKTDARINQWRSSPEYIIKLRIASKELAYQLRKWQKTLHRVSGNEEETGSLKAIDDALVVFIGVYFNLKPPAKNTLRRKR